MDPILELEVVYEIHTVARGNLGMSMDSLKTWTLNSRITWIRTRPIPIRRTNVLEKTLTRRPEMKPR